MAHFYTLFNKRYSLSYSCRQRVASQGLGLCLGECQHFQEKKPRSCVAASLRHVFLRDRGYPNGK